ncbi:hypothetical protein DC008_06885 [Streptomyces nigra]|nr:hypothetical protein DC008_06885 [Streptomyces nigra]
MFPRPGGLTGWGLPETRPEERCLRPARRRASDSSEYASPRGHRVADLSDLRPHLCGVRHTVGRTGPRPAHPGG